MKKIFIFLVILVVILLCIVFVLIPKKSSNIEKQVAEVRTKEYRSLTIINETKETLISECILSTVHGVLVARQEKLTKNNIIFANFDSEGAFIDEKDFKITLIDRYGFKYEKTFTAKEKGNTDLTVDEKDLLAQDGDWFRKMKRFFNK